MLSVSLQLSKSSRSDCPPLELLSFSTLVDRGVILRGLIGVDTVGRVLVVGNDCCVRERVGRVRDAADTSLVGLAGCAVDAGCPDEAVGFSDGLTDLTGLGSVVTKA